MAVKSTRERAQQIVLLVLGLLIVVSNISPLVTSLLTLRPTGGTTAPMLVLPSLPQRANKAVILSAAGAKDLLFDTTSKAGPSLRARSARFAQDDMRQPKAPAP